MSRSWQISLGKFDVTPTGFGGWTFSPQTFYDGKGQLTYLPNGVIRGADPQQTPSAGISAVAGNGQCCFSGDGGLATDAQISFPTSVAGAPDGSFYFPSGNRIRKVDPNGIITTVAGTGQFGFSGDNGPATSANISPWDLAVAPDGVTLYFTDNGTRIRRVDRNGIITTVAGNGVSGNTGDGGPGTSASVRAESVTVALDGSVYVASRQLVRRIDPFGIIRTVAGSLLLNATRGEGGPAILARFQSIIGIAIGPDGSLYLSDGGERTIRRITTDGLIRTIAGTPDFAAPEAQDGDVANQVRIGVPYGIAVRLDGRIFFSDSTGRRVWEITANGKITTFAGNGERTFAADPNGSLARGSSIPETYDVEIAPDGSVYMADSGKNFIRRVHSLYPSGFRSNTQTAAIASGDSDSVYIFEAGHHVRTVDRTTGTVLYTMTYDENGFLATVSDRNGRTTTVERDGAGRPTAIVAPAGQRTTLTLDSGGNLRSIVNPAGESYQFTYGTDRLLETLIDPRSGLHTFTYEQDGRLRKDEDPAGGSMALSLAGDANDYTVTRTSAEGRTTKYHVLTDVEDGTMTREVTGSDGLVSTTTTRESGTITSMAPDGSSVETIQAADPGLGMQMPIGKQTTLRLPSGLSLTTSYSRQFGLSNRADPLSVTERLDEMIVNGRTWNSRYDAATRTITTTTPLGRQQVTTLDSKGRVISVALPGLATTSYAYDALGRIASVTTGSRVLTFAYDEKDLPITVTDPISVTSFTHDAAQRVLTQTLPGGRTVTFAYDAAGNVVSVTPPEKAAHRFGYTSVNLLESYLPPSGQGTATQFNLDRQPFAITRPGETTHVLYDAAGRTRRLTTADGDYALTYSPSTGQLSLVEHPDGGTVRYSYDGPVVTGTTWTGTIFGSVSRGYDNNLRLADEDGTSFIYDDDGLLIAAGGLNITRDPASGLMTGTSLGVVTDAYVYNEFGEVTQYTASVNGTPVATFESTRDDGGRIRAQTAAVNGPPVTDQYGYDSSGRLASVTPSNFFPTTYAYDANGNRLSKTLAASAENGAYGPDDELLSYGDTVYTYTPDGAIDTKTDPSGTTDYDYDALGILRKVTLANGTVIDYILDAEGRRIGRRVNGAITHGWLYAGAIRIVEEKGPSGLLVSHFAYGTRSNTPDFMTKNGHTYRFITDHLGSPRLIIDTQSGAIAQQIEYDEFGNVLFDTNPGFQPFGFAGGLYDRDTGLVRFGARDYDPHTGRWLSKDPLLFGGGGTNFFEYGASDPVNWTDVTGLAYGDLSDIRSTVASYDQYAATHGAGTLRGLAKTGSFLLKNFGMLAAQQSGEAFGSGNVGCGLLRGGQSLTQGLSLALAPSGLKNVGTWIKSPIAYEMGARTVTSATFGAVADLPVAERGAVLMKEMGVLRYLFDPRGAWGTTLLEGPTPGGWLGLVGLGQGLGAAGGGCGCN